MGVAATRAGGFDAVPIDVRSLSAADESLECESSVRDAQTVAVARIVLAASLVEGDPERIELEDLCETLHTIHGLDGFDLCAAAGCIESLHAAGALDSVPVEPWIEEASHEVDDPALRRVAYQLAVYACAWDGVVTEREEAVLDTIADAFGFTSAEVEVMRESVYLAMEENAWPSQTSRERLSVV